MTTLIKDFDFLTEADIDVATELGITLSGSVDDDLNRVVQAQNSIAALTLASGYLLLKVKKEVEHGEFESKLASYDIPSQRASDLMRTAKFYTALPEEKRKQVYKLGKSKMQMLAKADFEVVQDILEDPEAGIGELSVRDMRRKISELEGKLSNANAKLEVATGRINRLEGNEFVTKFEHATEAVRDECMHLQAGCELNLNSLHKLFNDCMYGESVETAEQELRIEQIYVAISVAASRAITILESIREIIPETSRPVRIQGQHILTPEEAERWLLDSQMLAGKHEADKLARDVKRENAKEGKRGRKIGSKNKAAE